MIGQHVQLYLGNPIPRGVTMRTSEVPPLIINKDGKGFLHLLGHLTLGEGVSGDVGCWVGSS